MMSDEGGFSQGRLLVPPPAAACGDDVDDVASEENGDGMRTTASGS